MAIPYIPVKLDKERRLRFGMGLSRKIQELTGTPLAELAETMTLENVTKLAWASFKNDDPELTLEQTEDIIDDYYDGNIADFVNLVRDALNASFEDKKAKSDPKNAEKPKS